MARTESISFQVHPNDEQEQINLMQKFHWSLLGSQEIKVQDSHLESRGDSIYSVTQSEHYVKLTFSRDLSLPNLKEIKQLETEFFDLPRPKYPKLFPGHIALWLIATVFYGIGLIGWIVYYLTYYKPRKEEADQVVEQTSRKRKEILRNLQQYN